MTSLPTVVRSSPCWAIQRILEPELMDDEQQSVAYAQADFSTSNQLFVDSLVHDFPTYLRDVVDIGCGPADVVIRLAQATAKATITAIDGSGPMIALARAAARAAGVNDRSSCSTRGSPGRHLPRTHSTPSCRRTCSITCRIRRCCGPKSSASAPGAAVYVMDLVRPETPEAAQAMVKEGAGSEDPILQRDFYNSLLAAFSIDEVRQQLRDAGLELTVALAGPRHMLIKGTVR